jgi:hypothetical protein
MNIDVNGPIKKLVEVIAKGTGKLWEPYHTKRMANAKAYEINTITSAICETNLPIEYINGQITIKNKTENEILMQAKERKDFVLINQEENLNSILLHTAKEIKNEESLSIPDDDWISRYFGYAQDISSEEMQFIWSRILSGEMKKPGSFSLKTLDVVRNLSKNDAELIQKAMTITLITGNIKFLCANEELTTKYGINYGHILQLIDCDLLNSAASSINCDKETKILDLNNGVLQAKIKTTDGNFRIPSHIFSGVGQEISNIVAYEPNNEFFVEFAKWCKQHGRVEDVSISNIEKLELSTLPSTPDSESR